MKFCLTKDTILNFKKAMKSGEIVVEEMYGMTPDERVALLEKYVGKENAKQVNGLYESKLLLKRKEEGMITWAKTVIKDPVRRKTAIEKILVQIKKDQEILDYNNKVAEGEIKLKKDETLRETVLLGAGELAFQSDLVNTKLGLEINKEQAAKIVKLSEGMSELALQKGYLGLPTKEYMTRVKALADYITEITPSAPVNAVKIAGEIVSLPRTMMTMLDFSASLRQGVFLVASHPVAFTKAFFKQFAPAFSEKAYQKVITDIQTDPYYSLAEKSGLAITDLNSNVLKREEAFLNSWLEKIPVLGRIPRGSARSYTAFLDALRFDVFKTMVRNADQAGRDPSNDPELVKKISSFVNTASGRGELSGSLEKIAPELTQALFSPRLISSRVSLLNPVYYARLDPFVRKEAIKSLFAFASLGLTILGLAALNGAEVERDPRSTDFGKIKIGRTRIDIWGGFQQYIRLAAQLITNEKKNTSTGEIQDLNEGYKAYGRWGTLSKFAEGKSAPVTSYLIGWLKGVNFEGDDFDPKSEALERSVPIMSKDIYDLVAQGDIDSLKYQGLATFGIGVQTYDKNAHKINWEQSDTKELKQFKEEVGQEQFNQANEMFNRDYNAWYQNTINSKIYQGLSPEGKKDIISKGKAAFKDRVFEEYDFEYEREEASDEETDAKDELLPE
jgi:hypothetical protein